MSTDARSAWDLLSIVKDQPMPTGTTDWFYKALVPKDYVENLKFRERLLRLCYRSDRYIEDVQCMCRRDILFEINSFGFLFSPKDRSNSPYIPWITYEVQDKCFAMIIDSLEGTSSEEVRALDLTIPKTREVGGSWMVTAAFEHRWRHYKGQSFLVTSRKEDYVCKKGDKDALLQKAEFYTRQLPFFLQPKRYELIHTTMTYFNYEKDSLISGEATVENLGTGGRRTAILIDEASKMPNAKKIFTSTRDVTRCRMFVSSPNGREGLGAPFFHKVCNPRTRKFWIHWSDIPAKRKGLYYLDDKGRRCEFEEGWKWQDDYDFDQMCFSGRKPRSEWYDNECGRDEDEAVTSQELDLNFNKAGLSYVSEDVVSRWIKEHSTPPLMWGAISVDPDNCELTWHPQESMADAPFLLWIDLLLDEETGRYKVPLGEFIIGADIAAGTRGIHASYSALSIINRRTRTQVGRLCLRYQDPANFARISIGVCRWFHEALLVPEKQGSHGKTFMDTIETDPAIGGYWNLYRARKKDIGFEVVTDKVGLANTDGGTQIMNNLVAGINTKNVKILDATVFKEIGQYQMGADGKIFHTGVRSYDMAGNKGKTHGDVAIATACAYEELRRIGRELTVATADTGIPEKIPKNCPYARMKAREKEDAFTL